MNPDTLREAERLRDPLSEISLAAMHRQSEGALACDDIVGIHGTQGFSVHALARHVLALQAEIRRLTAENERLLKALADNGIEPCGGCLTDAEMTKQADERFRVIGLEAERDRLAAIVERVRAWSEKHRGSIDGIELAGLLNAEAKP